MTAPARPPFDAELAPALAGVPAFFTTLRPASIPEFRAATTHPPSIEEVIAGRPVEVADHAVTGHAGGEIIVSTLRRVGHVDATSPGVYLIHGGGMVGGTRASIAPMLVDWVLEYDAVAAAVEYRLAPEFPDPAPVKDCAAGFQWFVDRAAELAFDPRRVLIGGQSAGGALPQAPRCSLASAGDTCPSPSCSCGRCSTIGTTRSRPGRSTASGSGIARATRPDGPRCSAIAVVAPTSRPSPPRPARPTSPGCRPPTSRRAARVFRDEAVALATGIWAAGGSAELHVWAGGFHGFQTIVPAAAVWQTAVRTREAWVRRVLAP